MVHKQEFGNKKKYYQWKQMFIDYKTKYLFKYLLFAFMYDSINKLSIYKHKISTYSKINMKDKLEKETKNKRVKKNC